MNRILVVCCLVASVAHAEVYRLYVATRDTPAHTAAAALADGTKSFWFPKLGKAFDKATELLNGTDHEVRIMVAQGSHPGLVGLPDQLNGAKGRLLLLGGYCPDWKKRDPFGCPTEVVAGAGRPGGLLSFGSNKTLLGELVISGFVFDVAGSNAYDGKSNSLLKGSSRTLPIITLSQAVLGHLVIADNVFLNGPHRAFELFFSPMSNESVADIENNFFLNTVIPLKFAPAGYKGFKVKAVNFKGNSMILNWPFNPDKTSSNVGALELYHSDCCTTLNIEKNLFAYNPGGAMQHDWPTNRMGKLAIKGNLFFTNATLFGDARPEAGVFVGKFGPNPTHQVVALAAHMEDDYPYDFADNVSFDPKVPVALVDLQAADSSSVTAKKTVMNDVRGLFGLNKEGTAVSIKNFAPRMGLDLEHLPFPAEPKAAGYGVQREKAFPAP